MIHLAKRQAACRYYSRFNIFPTIEQSGKSQYLRGLLKINSTEHGKPDEPHMSGIPTVREGDGSVGRGCWKKRMPSGNGTDRGCYNDNLWEGHPI